MVDTHLTVAPYRVTFAEYRALSTVANFGSAYRLYNVVISITFTVTVQLFLWALALLTYDLTIGQPPATVIIGAIVLAGIAAFAACRVTGLWAARSYYRQQSISLSDYTITLNDTAVNFTLGELGVTAPGA